MKTLYGRIPLPDGSLAAARVSFDATVAAVDTAASTSRDYVLPGFIDLQVNGWGDIDVMTASPDGLLQVAEHLAREGTAAWLPTAITAPLERIEHAHASVGAARALQRSDSARASAAILGMHLEGPFISPARLGAHPRFNLEPTAEALRRIDALAELKLVTLAPEIAGALDAIRHLVARNVVVSIGHTDATFDQAQAGIRAGARMFTHLFNAMRPLAHRDPGAVTAALTAQGVAVAVIADSVHVAPEVLRLVYKLRGARGMILTTDRVALAGAHRAGRAARLANGTLAGSTISMLDGVRIMVNRVGASVAEAAYMSASNPASLLGIEDRGRVALGTRADLLVLGPKLDLKAVFVGGHEIA